MIRPSVRLPGNGRSDPIDGSDSTGTSPLVAGPGTLPGWIPFNRLAPVPVPVQRSEFPGTARCLVPDEVGHPDRCRRCIRDRRLASVQPLIDPEDVFLFFRSKFGSEPADLRVEAVVDNGAKEVVGSSLAFQRKFERSSRSNGRA